MAKETSVTMMVNFDKESASKTVGEYDALVDRICQRWSLAWDAAGQETIQTFADVFKAMDQGAADAFKTAKQTAADNLGGVLSEALSGDLDQARDILGDFGADMGKAFQGFGGKLAKSLTKEMADGLASVAQEFTINPVLDPAPCA